MIARWNPEKHLEMLGRWLKARGIADGAGAPELYPKVGLVVDDVAIGFLYQTDAPHVGWLDGIVTDPDSNPEDRARALPELIRSLYLEATTAGLRVVWSTTSARTLVELGQACGAEIFQRDHVCLSWTPR